MTARWRAASVLLLAATACGGDAAGSDDGACPGLDPGDPVTITTPFGDRELAQEWDATESGVEIELLPSTDGPVHMAVEMLGDDPPMLTTFADWITPTVAGLGVIETSTPCFPPVRLFTSSWLIAYDRDAFTRAGLDPDAPPATLDELHDAGVALRETAGYATPIAWPVPLVALFDLDIPTDDARRAAKAWTRLGTDGLLWRPPSPPRLPALGSGDAAIQLLRNEDVWDYANAIADGQAPGADIGVARVPGVDGPIAAIETFDWVVASGTTPEQQVAAAAFLRWLAEPEQQLRLHREHGLLPYDPETADADGFRAYWSERPLIEAAWDAMQSAPATPGGVGTLVGSWNTIDTALGAVAFDGADFDSEWAELERLVERGKAAQENDAAALIRCIRRPDGPHTLQDCV